MLWSKPKLVEIRLVWQLLTRIIRPNFKFLCE